MSRVFTPRRGRSERTLPLLLLFAMCTPAQAPPSQNETHWALSGLGLPSYWPSCRSASTFSPHKNAQKWLWLSFAPDKITDSNKVHIVEINRLSVQSDIDFMVHCITKAHNYKLLQLLLKVNPLHYQI